MADIGVKEGAAMKPESFLPEDYRPAEDEPFMNERQQEYFRRKLLACRLCAFSCLHNFAGIHCVKTALNRPPCRWLQALLPAGAADLCHDA